MIKTKAFVEIDKFDKEGNPDEIVILVKNEKNQIEIYLEEISKDYKQIIELDDLQAAINYLRNSNTKDECITKQVEVPIGKDKIFD